MKTLEQARAYFTGDRFAMDAGITIEQVDENYARCALSLQEKHRNAVGQVMGGVTYTLADFTFAVAANLSDCVTVTLTSQINYLNPVKGNILFGESRLIKDGKRNCFYEITITDDLGTKVASVMVTGAHLC